MTSFSSIKEIVSFAKSGAKLQAIAAAVLQNNKEEGLALLKEETIKAALAASLWNSPLKILTVIDTVKSGKKTGLVKQWLSATTDLSRNLPENKAGDVSRITDETSFVSDTNAAIAAWEKSWADYEASQKLKAEQRATKATPAPATPAPATPAAPAAPEAATPATPAPAYENSPEAANMRDEIEALREKLQNTETRLASALGFAKEKQKEIESANERIAQLESQLQEAQDSRNFLQQQLSSAVAEISVLRATQSPPTRKRAKKETTA